MDVTELVSELIRNATQPPPSARRRRRSEHAGPPTDYTAQLAVLVRGNAQALDRARRDLLHAMRAPAPAVRTQALRLIDFLVGKSRWFRDTVAREDMAQLMDLAFCRDFKRDDSKDVEELKQFAAQVVHQWKLKYKEIQAFQLAADAEEVQEMVQTNGKVLQQLQQRLDDMQSKDWPAARDAIKEVLKEADSCFEILVPKDIFEPQQVARKPVKDQDEQDDFDSDSEPESPKIAQDEAESQSSKLISSVTAVRPFLSVVFKKNLGQDLRSENNEIMFETLEEKHKYLSNVGLVKLAEFQSLLEQCKSEGLLADDSTIAELDSLKEQVDTAIRKCQDLGAGAASHESKRRKTG